MPDVDVAVIGAGVCGMQAAFRSAYRGHEVALIERERLGGTCLNRGCIPTKAMVRSAEVADLARRGEEFGIEVGGEVRPDLESVVARKDRIVDEVEETNQADVEAQENLTLVEGEAVFQGPHALDVEGTTVEAEQIVLATGARPLVPDWPGLDEVEEHVLTSRSLLDLTDRPDDLLVVGGGYIGVECAQMMARLDVPVTLLQRSTILKEEDQELVDVLREALEADGVDIREGTAVRSFAPADDGGLAVTCQDEAGKEATVTGDKVLVAVGRLPNAPSLDPEAAGVETWGPGWIDVDEGMRTSQDHIYAVGDAIGEQMFTHVGHREVEVATDNMLEDAGRAIDYHAAPHAIFSAPELARVGMTLEEAEEAGHDAEEVSFTYEHLGKALCLGQQEGMMKCVADLESGEFLGFHIVADHGAELLPEAVLVMERRGTVEEIADAIHIHPTMAEGVNEVAYDMALQLGRRRY
jgi:dihydrolipoamide dehydrogenase